MLDSRQVLRERAPGPPIPERGVETRFKRITHTGSPLSPCRRQKRAGCHIALERMARGIACSSKEGVEPGSYNECLIVGADKEGIFMRPLGFASCGEPSPCLTFRGCAEACSPFPIGSATTRLATLNGSCSPGRRRAAHPAYTDARGGSAAQPATSGAPRQAQRGSARVHHRETVPCAVPRPRLGSVLSETSCLPPCRPASAPRPRSYSRSLGARQAGRMCSNARGDPV